MRTRLTSDKKKGSEKWDTTGVGWYDTLRDHIINVTLAWGRENLPAHTKLTVHNVFAYLEWNIIERCLKAGKEALLMHDGIIFSSCDRAILEEQAHPHKFKLEQW